MQRYRTRKGRGDFAGRERERGSTGTAPLSHTLATVSRHHSAPSPIVLVAPAAHQLSPTTSDPSTHAHSLLPLGAPPSQDSSSRGHVRAVSLRFFLRPACTLPTLRPLAPPRPCCSPSSWHSPPPSPPPSVPAPQAPLNRAAEGGRGGEDGREGEGSRGGHRRRKEGAGRRGGGRGREEGRRGRGRRRAEGGGGGRREAATQSMSVRAQRRRIKLPGYLGYLAGEASRDLARV